MEHLIADSGIHFLTREIAFNPAEPVTLPDGKTLKYTFCDTSSLVSGQPVFGLLCPLPGKGVMLPLDELRLNADVALELHPDGRIRYDAMGLPIVRGDITEALFANYTSDNTDEVFGLSTLDAYLLPGSATEPPRPAFEALLGKWLPMPLFEIEDGSDQTLGTSLGWCRVKIEMAGSDPKTGVSNYRFIWAFDTETEKETDLLQDKVDLRPSFSNGERQKDYRLCNCADQMFTLLTNDPERETAFYDYIDGLIGHPKALAKFPHKHIAYYIYLVNFIRLIGAAPEVRLYNPDADEKKTIPVDLVLDIGNSRTCGVLFEDGDFTRAVMLRLQDLTHPERSYKKAFDMRLVFRNADFGGDIGLSEPLFKWRSFVRVGDEARHLVYRSLEDEGLSQKATSCSSPKRYLWDRKPFDGRWENLISVDDPTGVSMSPNIYIRRLSDYFAPDGTYCPEGYDGDAEGTAFSRSSLMTFVMIEILQQAIVQINSPAFREKHGDIDRKRTLRRIIITCPTAMPETEQKRLRQCAEEAYDAIGKCMPLPPAEIVPATVPQGMALDDGATDQRPWSYDEASCSQLVYLYAEIAQRYSGDIGKFFELKGHVRPEFAETGYTQKALTIGTIDIGAGTTDIMVAAYKCAGKDNSRLTPIPLFYDSFYLAGDDILRCIIQNVVIEGPQKERPDMGNITSALTARLLAMSQDELAAMPCVAGNDVYRAQVKSVGQAATPEEAAHQKRIFAANLVHDFFGKDSAMMSFKDRRCRLDFNTQISHPMSQFFMECLRLRYPAKTYTFDDIFRDDRPAGYLLDYFAHHFGFRFETLLWQYDPDEIAALVKNTMEPLLKRLSVIMHAYGCDILVLSGRPTSLDAITELFVKHLPLSPHRLVRLGEYHVGNWFPFADGQGFIYDQKAIVAVGAMVGYTASHTGFNGLVIDFAPMIKTMKSTAHYMGVYSASQRLVKEAVLTPKNSSASIDVAVFPVFIGCKQLASPQYEARPIYAIYNHSGHPSLRIRLSRIYSQDRELLSVEDVSCGGDTVSVSDIELVQQSIVDDGKYWLDKGEFELSIVKP